MEVPEGWLVNTIYNEARRRFATATLDWTGVELVLFAWRGPPNFVATDKSVADIVGRGVTFSAGMSNPITAKSVAADGTMQTNQVIIPAVAVGADITHFTMCQHISGLSNLILFIDDAEGLPFEPNGLDMAVSPDWLANRGWGRV
jgi:hypothetical protein